MIDTHTHLYFPDYGEEIDAIMDKCRDAGVSHFVLPNVDEASLSEMKKFHRKFPDVTSMAIGIHPTEVKEYWKDFMGTMEKELESGEYVAVGEIGIDLYWDASTLPLQGEAFVHQLGMAEKYRLPVIIHSRNAFEETMQVIEELKPTVPLIFHSFTGTKDDVDRIRKGCDPYFGINGVVTYKNAPDLREALPVIGINRIVLETDAPFLTPVPHRGKRNDSGYLPFIRDKVAEVLEIEAEEVDKATDSNARAIFMI